MTAPRFARGGFIPGRSRPERTVIQSALWLLDRARLQLERAAALVPDPMTFVDLREPETAEASRLLKEVLSFRANLLLGERSLGEVLDSLEVLPIPAEAAEGGDQADGNSIDLEYAGGIVAGAGAGAAGPDQDDVDGLRGLLELMVNFPSDDQRARFILSSNWGRKYVGRG